MDRKSDGDGLMDVVGKGELQKKVELFIDREKETDDFKNYAQLLRRGFPKHLLLLGPRRIGKTHVILKYLSTVAGKEFVPVYVDLLYQTSWIDVSNFMAESIFRNYEEFTGKRLVVESFSKMVVGTMASLLDRIPQVEAELGSEGASYLKLRLALEKKEVRPIDFLISTLRFLETFGEKKDVYIVVVFDEIQQLARFEQAEVGLAAIRSEMQFQKKVQYIFSGSSPTFVREKFLEKTAPLWKQLGGYTLEPFTERACQLVLDFFSIRYTTEIPLMLKRTSNGIPDYVVKIAQQLVLVRKRITPSEMQEAFEKVAESEKQFVRASLDKLTSLQLRVLERVAAGKNRYADIEKAVEGSPSATIRILEDEELIRKVGKGEYQVLDPVIQYYLVKASNI